jgi:hypothetical protein
MGRFLPIASFAGLRTLVPVEALRTSIEAPVTATTDFLALDILDKCGSADPVQGRALHRTRRPIAEGPPSFPGPRKLEQKFREND